MADLTAIFPEGFTADRAAPVPEWQTGADEAINTAPANGPLAFALRYAAMGWPVFPLKPGTKQPGTQHGFREATTDPARIRAWWQATPDAGIGLFPHGAGLFALDVDTKRGGQGPQQLEALEAEHGPLPATLTARTPSGATHLLFRCGEPLGNHKIAPDIDVRCAAGYIAVEPTRLAGGAGYSWLDWDVLADEPPEIAELPQWVVELARQKAAGEAQGAAATTCPPADADALRERLDAFLSRNAKARQRWEGGKDGLNDKSGSAMDISMIALLKIGGFSYSESVALLSGWPHGSSSEARGQERYWRRAWANSSEPQQQTPSDTAAAPHVWPEPTPLPDSLPPVQAFDAELLPEALRGWIMDIAERMQCPPDFAAVGAVAALSSLIGARAVVQPKERDDWQVVPNLWGLIVGRPGVMKSPALNEALKPLHRLEAGERERHAQAMAEWETDCKLAELQAAEREKKAKALVSKDPSAARALLEPAEGLQAPAARRYIVNDATVERLGELLMANPWGTLSYRDELYGLLTGMERQGQEGSRAFYLQGSDGDKGYTFDRIIRGTTYIPRVCLAMVGGIQPGRIQQYVRDAVAGGSSDDGLLQRFALTVWPDVSGEFVNVDRWPDTAAKQQAWAVFERLDGLQPASETDPVVWRFDPAAQALFNEWRIGFEQELKRAELHPAMESHLSKYRKLIPALALIFAQVDTPTSGNLIHESELLRSLAWGEYLRTHAERLYAAATTPETAGARALLHKLKAGKLTDADGVIADSFTPRQVAIKHWAGLDTPEAVRKAADALVEYDWLRRDVIRSGDAMGRGRPSECYLINPALFGNAS